MNSKFNQEDLRNVKEISSVAKVCAVLVLVILIHQSIVAMGLGLATASQLVIGWTLSSFSSPEVNLGQHFSRLAFALSPLWGLYLDPSASALLIWMTAASAVLISTELKNNHHRVFYASLTVISWLIIFLIQGTTFDFCHADSPDHLRRDSLVTAIFFTFNLITLSKYADASLKSTKTSLAEVKELNLKFEALNKELKQLLDDKDNFILLFSHETRNPLNILLGNLALLLDEANTSSLKNKLNRSKFCADLLLHNLNNILDSGKLFNHGILEVSPTPIKLYEYIQSTQGFMDMLVKKKADLKPLLLIPQRLPTTLSFDTHRLTQVILNLLTNAVKFTESGSISLVVRYLNKPVLEESDYLPLTYSGYTLTEDHAEDSTNEFHRNLLGTENQNSSEFQRVIKNLADKKKETFDKSTHHHKGYLKIEISDTGCGMKPEELSKLFQKFSQTHADRNYRKIGTGLGLWITKKLCKFMGGNVTVYSKPRVGTTFVAIVQADYLPSPPSLMRNNTQTFLACREKSAVRRMLLADDDPYNLDFHLQIAKTLGYDTIETACDGHKLVEIFKARPEGYFEVIVTDIYMPDFNGIDAIRMIRAFEQSQRRKHIVKVGVITGHSNNKDQSICLKGPINALFYLSKPIKASMIEAFLEPQMTGGESSQGLTISNKSNKHNPLILCADDDLFNLDCLEEMFNTIGATTIKAKSGEDAILKVKTLVCAEKKVLSFILMDCRMPGIDGWTASARIKELLKEKSLPDIPIIGLTGDDLKRNEDKYKQSGMSDILQKPISRGILCNLIARYS